MYLLHRQCTSAAADKTINTYTCIRRRKQKFSFTVYGGFASRYRLNTNKIHKQVCVIVQNLCGKQFLQSHVSTRVHSGG